MLFILFTFFLIELQYRLEMFSDMFSSMVWQLPKLCTIATASPFCHSPHRGEGPWSWHSGCMDVDETWPLIWSFRDAFRQAWWIFRNALRPEPKSQFFRMILQERFLEGVKLQMDWWHESHEPPKNLRPKQIRGSRCSVDFPQITEICERFIKSWWLSAGVWGRFGSCVMTTIDVKRCLKSQKNIDTPLTQACANYDMKNARYINHTLYT